MDKSLKANCIGEFLGTALLIFFGVGCVAALKVAGASFGLWEIALCGGWALHLQYMQQRVYLAHI
ncbi:glycerol facilitator [Haemophilus influenzae]|nr:Glycerol uptake facilitator protein [Haemophilus influenzae]PRL87176.1 Glycerol uptake facilitator protein [Haemophilus influenzae]CWX09852.1 glycerol facilitator [Haemophilus influenzae]CWX53709.1 glycerol facilitator [Haemophilus influenzae]